jgi:hypothetical protein
MDVIEQLTAVAAVLLLLGGTLWWLRRRGFVVLGTLQRPKQHSLEHLERMSLGPQHTLHLLRLGDMDLLVSASPAGCALVHCRPHQAPEATK